jgi:hypothetical protein
VIAKAQVFKYPGITENIVMKYVTRDKCAINGGRLPTEEYLLKRPRPKRGLIYFPDPYGGL